MTEKLTYTIWTSLTQALHEEANSPSEHTGIHQAIRVAKDIIVGAWAFSNHAIHPLRPSELGVLTATLNNLPFLFHLTSPDERSRFTAFTRHAIDLYSRSDAPSSATNNACIEMIRLVLGGYTTPKTPEEAEELAVAAIDHILDGHALCDLDFVKRTAIEVYSIPT